MSLESQTRDPTAQSLSRRICTQDFYVLKKIYRRQPGLNPRTLDLRRVRYPKATEADQYHLYITEIIKS